MTLPGKGTKAAKVEGLGLGPMIKALRRGRDMTQAELAARVGVSRSSITNIERGNQILTETTVKAIAEALGYRVAVKFELLRTMNERA